MSAAVAKAWIFPRRGFFGVPTSSGVRRAMTAALAEAWYFSPPGIFRRSHLQRDEAGGEHRRRRSLDFFPAGDFLDPPAHRKTSWETATPPGSAA